MSLVLNINVILYNLEHFRSFVLRKSLFNNKIFIANNNIAFSLTKKENMSLVRNKSSFTGSSVSNNFKQLKYKDAAIFNTTKKYPVRNVIAVDFRYFLENYFNLTTFFLEGRFIKGVMLKRSKKGFIITSLGIHGHILTLNLFSCFANIWSKMDKALVYKPLTTYMLFWLKKNIILNLTFICFQLLTKEKKKFYITKYTKKRYYKKESKLKSLKIFSSENIPTLYTKQLYCQLVKKYD